MLAEVHLVDLAPAFLRDAIFTSTGHDCVWLKLASPAGRNLLCDISLPRLSAIMPAVVFVAKQQQLQMKMDRVSGVMIGLPSVGHVEHLLCGLAVDAAELGIRLRTDRRFVESRSLGFAPSVALEEMKAVDYPT